ncbi:MAG TPA: helix-turn-helix transcriptional regulator [Candidatus Angelobacter sp.]|jgi:transcriptional regulator with XRE-family HTH domain|nr:helix-turn-helix transcriptional regulator [Candidatus Angelobacter sp.]
MTDNTHGDKEVFKPLGERIRDLRLKKDWSQQELAKAAGLTDSHVGEIERGEIDSSLETLFRIAQAFNITASELFEGII